MSYDQALAIANIIDECTLGERLAAPTILAMEAANRIIAGPLAAANAALDEMGQKHGRMADRYLTAKQALEILSDDLLVEFGDDAKYLTDGIAITLQELEATAVV